ncbi:dihydrofolate reductase [Clostridium paridis]|uniref:Dihydrofolate reductase n=1 Tax=Clostridium paridis TaxID=2803863 RepID=A0A937FJU3_9CLOT|nr:dihydrofolate reductase [Clostridium paridis]MBL4933708.1 dihydrofolate reductase [Clostridium paridis]
MLSIIVAVAENNAIGKNNDLLWRLPSDLRRFKEITSGKTIIMGRKTFESLPKVLPNRHHVILTRDTDFSVDDPQVEVVNSLDAVVEKFHHSEEEAFIIGGGEIYSAFLPYSNKLYLTKVFKDFGADTYFPNINENEWMPVLESKVFEENNLTYQFTDLVRK